LSVRRGSADEQLYSCRLERVRQVLEQSGVDVAQMRINDSTPGGEGMAGTRVADILTQEREERSQSGAARQTYTIDTPVEANL
jgi:hypothetical protein